MTLYETISTLASVASSLAILASLYLVVRQTKLLSDQTEYLAKSISDNLVQSMNEQSHEIGRLFVAYPELRPYFYEKQSITPEHEHYHRAFAVAELMLDIFWTMSLQSRNMLRSSHRPGDGDGWAAYVSDCFDQGPILVEVLKLREAWYGTEMLENVKRYREKHLKAAE
jgi:hypothetical protein